MTVDEYRSALAALSADQFQKFRESWGGTADTVEGCVQAFAYATDPTQWERIVIFRLRERGIVNLRTEADKLMEATQDSAAAAKSSASAAELSAVSAAHSVRWARFSVVVALLAAAIAAYFGLLGEP